MLHVNFTCVKVLHYLTSKVARTTYLTYTVYTIIFNIHNVVFLCFRKRRRNLFTIFKNQPAQPESSLLPLPSGWGYAFRISDTWCTGDCLQTPSITCRKLAVQAETAAQRGAPCSRCLTWKSTRHSVTLWTNPRKTSASAEACFNTAMASLKPCWMHVVAATHAVQFVRLIVYSSVCWTTWITWGYGHWIQHWCFKSRLSRTLTHGSLKDIIIGGILALVHCDCSQINLTQFSQHER